MSSSQQVFQQRRVTEAGELAAITEGLQNDIHQEIEVTHTTEGALSATVSLWNVSRDSWRTIGVGDPFRIGLGYLSDPFTTVFFGSVDEKSPPERDEGGVRYRLSGLDQSMERIQNTYVSHTWVNPSIGEIVSDIAGMAGLAVGYVDPPGAAIGERWPICRENSLAHWLDLLVREAQDFAETRYEWSASGGQLHFHRRDRDGEQAVNLMGGDDGNTIRIDESSGDPESQKSGGGNALEFEAYLDPRLRRNGLVAVDTEDYQGVYRITDYAFESSTETGDHRMRGTLEPTSAQYVIDPTHSPAREQSSPFLQG